MPVGARLSSVPRTEPSRVQLTLHEGGAPWTRKVLVRWTVRRQTVVFEGTPNSDGILPEFHLDGGQAYELVAGRAVVPLRVVSGTTYEQSIDLGRVVELAAEKPGYALPGRPFTVGLTVTNRGTRQLQTVVAVHAEDATTDALTQTVAVAPGESTVVQWIFTAGEGNRPYVLFFVPDGDRDRGLDVTGEILP